MPVYNGEKTIKRCVKSILKQSFSNIELIIVNDGSKDRTKEILEKLSRIDERIVVLNQCNNGVEIARYNGIKAASGDFLMFVDADDTLPKDACQDLISAQLETDADVVFGKMQRVFYRIIKQVKNDNVFNNLKISKKEFLDDFYISFFGVNIVPVNVCGKLYRKELFNDVVIFGLKHGEDLCLNMDILPNAELICSIDKVVYNYYFGGMTTKYNQELLCDATKAYEIKKNHLTKYNLKKSFIYTDIELVNFLITDIQQAFLYKSLSDIELLNLLKQKLSSESIINCLVNLKETIYYEQPKFAFLIDGVLNKNENDLITWINLALGNRKKLKSKFVIKKFLNMIL